MLRTRLALAMSLSRIRCVFLLSFVVILYLIKFPHCHHKKNLFLNLRRIVGIFVWLPHFTDAITILFMFNEHFILSNISLPIAFVLVHSCGWATCYVFIPLAKCLAVHTKGTSYSSRGFFFALCFIPSMVIKNAEHKLLRYVRWKNSDRKKEILDALSIYKTKA